jgi:tRNA threonylcarbamoyladenosine biosynthesis protein TsaB
MIDGDGILLAIETSQREGSVALRLSDGSILEHSFACGSRGEDNLLPSIDTLFTRANLTPADLSAVAVSVGPGGFTGLRIATSTAKGLAEGTGCRLVSVPSAMVAAESTLSSEDHASPVVVLAAAKSTTCWLSRLERKESGWVESERSGLHVIDPPEESVLELCQDAIVLADRFLPDELSVKLSGAHRILEPRWSAAACARIGHLHLKECRDIDPLEMKPLYPREPEAVSLWKARKG